MLTILVATVILLNSVSGSSDFEKIATDEEMKKANKCIVDSIGEVTDITKLVVDIVSENFVGAAMDIFKVTKGIFSMLKNCKTLFCFGPSYDKCNSENSQGCEKNGLVIYPKCKEGYTNFGCCVCATQCPKEFTDNGLFCLKPGPYGRGVGYVIWQKEKCERENSQGCEQNGAMWYPKCRAGFHAVGCCICSPNCPEGWTDIGISCQKPSSYGRGVGYPVSFGQQCIEIHAKEKAEKMKKEECMLLKEKMNKLKDTVKLQTDQAQQNQKVFPDLPDNVKELSQMVHQYANGCLN